MKSGNCLNCESLLEPQQHFCPNCGQKTDLHRFSLHEISHETLHYFIHADKSFLHLLRSLLIHTGKVGREYVGGKRRKYFPALNFYLLVGAIYVILINVQTSYAPVAKSAEQAELNRITDPSHREYVRRLYARRGEAVHFMNKYSNFISMIAIPLIAFIYWLFYIRNPYNYAEHLVGGMYMAGFTNLFYVLILVPVSVQLGPKYSFLSLLFFLLFQVTYFSVYYYRFINKRTMPSLFKAIGVSVFATIFWTALTSFLVGLYISNGFWGLVQ